MPFIFADNQFESGWELINLGEREVTNEVGAFELIELRTENMVFVFPSEDELEKDLNLIYGIGSATISKLNEASYFTIRDLLRHPRWQKAAAEILRIIAAKDLGRLARYGASDLQLLSFFKPEEIVFIDIETTGLYYIHPVFLIGMLAFENGQGRIKQLLARDFSEEKAVLYETFKRLKAATVIVSFNGRSFDLPYLKGRMRFHGLTDEINTFHFDLLRQVRKNYRSKLPNCKLLTIERHLFNRERIDDLPGSQVGEYYQRYLDTGDRSYLTPILEHNACDLLTMAKILGLITTNRRKVI